MAGLAPGDPAWARLRARVIEWYLPMSAYVARRFGGRGESLDDLTQVATVGLIKAVDRFDPTLGVDFASYAIPTMTGEIKRYFRDLTWRVRVPRRLQVLVVRMPAATAELLQTLRRAPTNAELAVRLGIGVRDLVLAQLAANAYRPFSIEQGSPGRVDPRPADRLGGPDPDLEAVVDGTAVRGLLALLPIRERRILVMRFEDEMTQAQIAAAIGISQMHVSRLLAESLARLREGLITELPASQGAAQRRSGPAKQHRQHPRPTPAPQPSK
jgi:RNA polymerase sigma-B factor